MSTEENFVCQCVKPKCVQGRWMDVLIDRKAQTLTVQEYANPLGVCTQIHTIPLLDANQERVIGQPVCVAAYDDICIIQYITRSHKFIRFMLADLKLLKVQLFEDSFHYFNRDISTVFPVECLISPDKSKVLVRLPQPVMSNRKWSKMLSANLTSANDLSSGSRYFIENLKSDGLRDRRNQAVAFDPRYKHCLVHVLIDEYCGKFQIMLYNLQKKSTIAQKTHNVRRTLTSSSDSDEDEGTEDVSYYLLECNADYNRNGTTLVVCCLLQSTDQCQGLIRVFIFDTNSFQLLRSIEKTTAELGFEVYVIKKQLIVPIFDYSDESFSLWLLEKFHRPVQLDLKEKLPTSVKFF